MRVKDALGRFGEDTAVRYLLQGGMEILDRNWRCAAGEIDIVARDGLCLVFCEVKTRSSDRYGTPAQAVVAGKAARIRRVAAQWLHDHEHELAVLRFDVVEVYRRRDSPIRVEHLRGAF
ncbi:MULTISPECIES: YraN family protein [unclassified Frankia]|uniref:YraN family protein n=1 Tax=unclassified Frankia TaxID=2632575 RepID=UPI001EF593A5|nr:MULTISPECIES: YraN family protein [unclassified Frankia]